MIGEVLALPGALGRDLVWGHGTEIDATQRPVTVRSLLRKILLPSRQPQSPCLPPPPETPKPATQAGPSRPVYRIPIARSNLENAQTYSDWLAAATELDALEGHDDWKLEEDSMEYDVYLIKASLREMDNTRISHDYGRIMNIIRTRLDRRKGGIDNVSLYKHSRLGTKALIEQYISSVQDTIDAFVEMTMCQRGTIPIQDVYRQLLLTRQTYGRSALLLSGGGTFGMNHIGVIKSLFEANLLPRIVSGASAGSIVASVLCTKLDEEIPDILKSFCYGDLAVFEKPGQETNLFSKAYRFMTQGSLFDISNLVGVMRDLLGDLTFEESYRRTRRILNICVSPASMYELPRLLNYATAPNVIIWSAVAASCSVPFVFSPAQLLVKTNDGSIEPWAVGDQTHAWIDGSVTNDIPTQRLAEMFNVNHFIVSQVNPHVVPFLEKDEEELIKEAQGADADHAPKTSWGHAMTILARDEAMHRLEVLQELGIFPNVMSKVRAVVSQKYAGDITIFPKISYANFPYVLSNPDTDFMLQATLSGEKATWPKLSEIRNHCAIELALDDAVHRLLEILPQEAAEFDDFTFRALAAPGVTPMHKSHYRSRSRSIPRQLSTLSIDLAAFAQEAAKAAAPKRIRFEADKKHKKGPAPKKFAGPDLHAFSDSEPEEDEDYEAGHWQLSADESPTDTTDENSPTPFPAAWHNANQRTTRSTSSSMPATPGMIASMEIAPLLPCDPPSHTVSAPQTARPSSPEMRYKRVFHDATAHSTSGFTSSQSGMAIRVSRSAHDLGSHPMPMGHRRLSVGRRAPTLFHFPGDEPDATFPPMQDQDDLDDATD